ncbi:MAG TPA: hypothetical protein VGE04_10350 [Chloroflexia bacterium]|jgi:hypothetical protein
MTGAKSRMLPDAAAKVQILLVYLLTIASAVVVFQWATGLFYLFHTMPKAEQIKLPAVMPWEVYELQPWLVVVGHIYVSLILLACAVYAVWGTRAFLRVWKGWQDVDVYSRSSGKVLLIFWVLAVVAFFFAVGLSFGALGGVSYGMD